MSFIVGETNQKDYTRPITGNFRQEFEAFLAENGLSLDQKKGLLVDGSIGRAYMDVDGKHKLTGWYQFWADQTIPFGRCGDYRIDSANPTSTWRPNNSGNYKMTDEQREEIKLLQDEAQAKKEERNNRAAKRSQNIWEAAAACTEHPYLTKKNVESHGLKQHADGRMMVPLLDQALTIVGLQYIDDDGGKMFLTGSKKKASFFILGQDLLKDAHTINYCEGYATAASYYQDMKQPVVVSFDAYNLAPVAEVIFGHFAQAKHVIIADFDDNATGEREAIKAAQVIKAGGGQAEVLMPQSKGDYNDHKEAMVGEIMPSLQEVVIPAEFDFERNSNGRYLHTKDNHRGVLVTNQIEVDYNVIKKAIEIEIPHQKFIADLKDDSAIIEIEDRCIKMGIPHERVRFNLKLLAREYNPVKEWMESEPWDGKARLQMFLDTIKSPNEPLKEMLMKKWLLGCVAAACEEGGANLEGILVFQGAQAVGKTQWFNSLAPNKDWLLEGATLNPQDKDSVKQCVSHWICELGELGSTFKRADIDQLKAFLTKRSDELRLPYDRAFSNYQRRTAFYASVNEKEFLIDTSGNRRFWVVPVTEIDWRHGLNMQQVWAEIKTTMYEGKNRSWFLTSEERVMLQDSNEFFRTQSAVEDLLLQYIRFKSADTKPVQMTHLLRDMGINNPRMADFKDAARVLADRGVEPRYSNGKKIYDLDYDSVIKADDNFPPPPKWEV